MLIARQKLQENIAEYLLYMFQIEDVVRACEMDLDRLMSSYVIPQLPDPSLEDEYRKWYGDIVRQMKLQRLEKQGHMHELREIMVELSYLHNTLMNLANDHKYKGIFEQALPYINEFKERSNLKDRNEIDVSFHALYMKLLLKLQRKEISESTEEAFDAMRAMLAYLAKAYHKMKQGDLDFLKN
jgi:hypothetical protein